MPGAAPRPVRVGDVLPQLALTDAAGEPRPPLPANRATVFVVLHLRPCPACRSYLAELEGALPDLADWGTRVVAVQPDVGIVGEVPFTVLTDRGGASRRRLGIADDEAAVLLADRWNEVMEAATVGSDHGFPLVGQLVQSAKIVDLSCGECNVPGPEWRRDDN